MNSKACRNWKAVPKVVPFFGCFAVETHQSLQPDGS